MSNVADKIAVMQAFAEGRQIQSRLLEPGYSWDDCEHEPHWNWGLCNYRVAPQPPEREPREFTLYRAGHASKWEVAFLGAGEGFTSPDFKGELAQVVELLPGWEVVKSSPASKVGHALQGGLEAASNSASLDAGEPPQAQADGFRYFRCNILPHVIWRLSDSTPLGHWRISDGPWIPGWRGEGDCTRFDLGWFTETTSTGEPLEGGAE